MRRLAAPGLRTNKYLAHIRPWPKQAAFLIVANMPIYTETLFGGGAGPGKSFALLYWLMQYADVPGYSAAAFRRTSPELYKAGGLIPTSKKMLAPVAARGWCTFHEQRRTWYFDSGAQLSFGSLQYDDDADALDGLEFARLGFDELTKFSEYQWLRAQSRLRVPRGFPVKPTAAATSNPDGPGRQWVKARFGCGQDDVAAPGCVYVHTTPRDNPKLDLDAYLAQLAKLPPTLRRQKEHGDWDVESTGPLWGGEHFPRYDTSPQALARTHAGEGKVFCTADLKNKVSTSTRVRKGESFVSLCMWLGLPGRLYLLDEEHGPWGLDDTLKAFWRLKGRWPGCRAWYIEDKAMGPEAMRRLKRGVTLRYGEKDVSHPPLSGVVAHSPKGKKEVRTEGIQPNVLAGDIFVPNELAEPWAREWLSELARAPHAPNDRTDTTVMAVERHLVGGDIVAAARNPQAMSKMLGRRGRR